MVVPGMGRLRGGIAQLQQCVRARQGPALCLGVTGPWQPVCGGLCPSGDLLARAQRDPADEVADPAVAHQPVEVLPGPLLQDADQVANCAAHCLDLLPLREVLQ
ncbi:hypothetical protein [Streptomyces lavendulocolor]|uniref:hypothetical protein n=1 Tax=Streptomyces lavendulocolor TaxID=67316 RepID=UPI003C2FBDDA